MPSDPKTETSGYVLRLNELEYPLGMRRSHPLDYVTPVIGKVTHGKTERERQTVCEFSFQHLRLGWARGDRFSVKALFGCNPSLEEMLPLLFDPTAERLTFGADERRRNDERRFDRGRDIESVPTTVGAASVAPFSKDCCSSFRSSGPSWCFGRAPSPCPGARGATRSTPDPSPRRVTGPSASSASTGRGSGSDPLEAEI